MNFKRLLKSDIEQCLTNDLRFWIGKQLIKNEKDYSDTVNAIKNGFKTIAELHHMTSAQLEDFPSFKLLHLERVLTLMTRALNSEEAET